MSTVSTREHLPFVLLEPGFYPAREGEGFQCISCGGMDLSYIVEAASASAVVAVDFETTGVDPHLGSGIIGVGLAWDTGSCYFHTDHIGPWARDRLFKWLVSGVPLLAHNVAFDGWFLWNKTGKHANFVACTYGLYRQLATESFDGQKWGLKNAEKDLLGWTETNDIELSQWLVLEGYRKSYKKEPKEGYCPILHNGEMRWASPDKSEMWRAPSEILGKYCVLDAEACYLLYTKVLEPVARKFPALQEYHSANFLPLVRVLTEQTHRGILVNRSGMEAHLSHLSGEIEQLTEEFRYLPDVVPHIKGWEAKRKAEHLVKEPSRFLDKKGGEEPKRFKKDGGESKSWLKWKTLAEEPPQERPNWTKWKNKLDRISAGDEPAFRFNLNSDKQMRWLFFDCLGYEPHLFTPSGQPALDESALGLLGEPGKLLQKRNERQKEREYNEAYIELLTPENTIHPKFRTPGTVTGRLSGNNPNLQQVPKTRGTLENFIARPEYCYVDCDVVALEQVVLAEMSGDASLWKLYAPDAKPNDVYLFVGSQLPVLGEPIQRAGYDPQNPTKEGIAAAKKAAKHERSVAKVVVLASSYGAGAGKIHKTLSLSGVKLELEEVQAIHAQYWKLFSGVKKYQWRLEEEWRINGGWVLNGVGRPIGVDENYKKDIVNRVVQSTGHDLLLSYIQYVVELLKFYNIEWYPVIMDFHDESIIEVRNQDVEKVKHIMEKEAYDLLNQELGWKVKLKGSATVAYNLAGIKIED